MEKNLQTDAEITEIAKLKGKLEAIRVCKLMYGLDLNGAKNHVDELTKGMQLPKQKIDRKGCLIVFVLIAFIGLMVSLCTESKDTQALTQAQNDSIKSAEVVSKSTSDSIAKLNVLADKKWNNTKAGRIHKKHPDWDKDDCENIAKGKIWIGMDINMVAFMWGRPDKVNKSNYGNGIQYQYCWDDYNPSYFYCGEDNIVTAYN